MVLKVSGLKKKSYRNSILGYTDTETVMVDLDEMPFQAVKKWAMTTMRWFRLRGFIILKSSENCYHVVFDRAVSWSRNMHVVAWVSLLSKSEHLHRWLEMQCIKESSTLRISPKGGKPSPRVVFRYGQQDGQINGFLQFRRMIKNIIRNLTDALD